jgi:DeoR/GlpR family transcriptional regulator of sugar metabolism
VTAQPSGVFESNVAFRMTAGTEEKAAIAAVAAPLVEAGMSVMFDDSTSALAVARALDDALPITAVTNFLEIITLAAARPATRLIALGGEYHATHTSFLGVPCADAVAGLHVDLLFASVSGVAQGHVFHQEQEIVQVKRAMLRAAQRSVLLVDHTKLDRLALHRLAPLTDFDLVITDARTPKAALKTLREQHPEVTVAPLPAP